MVEHTIGVNHKSSLIPILKPPDVCGFAMIDGEQLNLFVVNCFQTRKQMNNPKLEEIKLFKQPDDLAPTMSEYEASKKKIRANLEQFGRERLARMLAPSKLDPCLA